MDLFFKMADKKVSSLHWRRYMKLQRTTAERNDSKTIFMVYKKSNKQLKYDDIRYDIYVKNHIKEVAIRYREEEIDCDDKTAGYYRTGVYYTYENKVWYLHTTHGTTFNVKPSKQVIRKLKSIK